jgi:hypothetical protein
MQPKAPGRGNLADPAAATVIAGGVVSLFRSRRAWIPTPRWRRPPLRTGLFDPECPWARPALLIDLGIQARAFQQRRGSRVRGSIRRPQISEFDARGHDVLESSVDAYLDNKGRCVTQVFIGHYLFKIDRAHSAPEMSDHEPRGPSWLDFPTQRFTLRRNFGLPTDDADFKSREHSTSISATLVARDTGSQSR